MFLLPIFALVAAGFVVSVLYRRRMATAHHGEVVGDPRAGLWPTTTLGWASVLGVVLVVLEGALVNVVQVRFMRWGLVGATLATSAVARWWSKDRSMAVTIIAIGAAVGLTAGLLFLAGEVLIGHD